MGFVLFIHVVVCILLVIAVLMQAGRGGGLAESFSAAENMFGTQTNAFMVRFSVVLAALFLGTSVILAIDAAKGQKSLMAAKKNLLPKTAAVAPKAEADEPKIEVKIDAPKPMTVTDTVVNAAQ